MFNLKRVYFAGAFYQLLPFFNLRFMQGDSSTATLSDKQQDLLERSRRTKRYWQQSSIHDLLRDADTLYEEGNYLEVYESLNRLKYKDNVQVSWRICRALYQLSLDKEISDGMRKEMILEAYELISNRQSVGMKDSQTFTWLAIITNARSTYSTITTPISKAQSVTLIKQHLETALELNPDDKVVLYLLGKLCYDLSSLTWIQRFLAELLYGPMPDSTYSEAYEYLNRACRDEPSEGYYVPCLYMLGKTCVELKQYFRARYYLHAAATLPARTDVEWRYAVLAKGCVKKWSRYDLDGQSVVFEIGGDGGVPQQSPGGER